MHVYVKALLQIMYEKYKIRDGVGWQMQLKTNPSAVFDMRPTPSTAFFHASPITGALTDLLLCIGRIRISSSDGPRTWCM